MLIDAHSPQSTGDTKIAPGVNIVLTDDEATAPFPAFVEIEDDHGRSLHLGAVSRDTDGYLRIRITAADIEAATTPSPTGAAA